MMDRFNSFIIFCCFLFVVSNVNGQRMYNISKNKAEIKIDGELSESVWGQTDLATDFTISYPNFGDSSQYKTVIHLFYDDEALYIGGILYDEQPDSVSYSLSQRDDTGNADWVGITIDPYASNVTSFTFVLTSAGVESDALEYVWGPDFRWNAVWRSATQKREDGWSFEMRIPFSAIRFPTTEIQSWNMNFSRQVRRDRELSTWNPVNPEIIGGITQSGKVEGVKDIKSPLRLSLTPYVTGYLENSYNYTTQKQEWRQRVTGGVDLKYGINDAFTLDMTLIPDFGQTTSDNQVLNLSAFEVRYNENRPFFLEGMDLFGIGNVFYSRRIGGTPFNFYDAYNSLEEGEEVVSISDVAPLLNATKVSGRTTKGLGIGVFNAIEGRSNAIILDSNGHERLFETNPFTNYNVIALSQNLKNNSTISFLNTHVFREGSNRDANVSVFETDIFTPNKDFEIKTSLKISSIYNNSRIENGHSMGINLDKVSGTFGYSFYYGEISDTYDPNDLGFLYNNNSRHFGGGVRFNQYTAGKYFLRRWTSVNVNYRELYKPQLFSSFNISGSSAGTLKNFLTLGVNGSISPFGSVDHFDSRTFGKEILNDANYRVGGFLSTDYSKRFALDVRPWLNDYVESERIAYGITVSPRVRVSDRMFFVWRTSFDKFANDYGYVSISDDDYNDQIILGVRNREVIVNSINTEFVFTKRMGIDVRFRHYWQQVDYTNFLQLLDDGEMIESPYNPVGDSGESQHNTSYNAFTIDVNFTWIFFPGSQIRLVYKNNIFDSKSELDPSYFNTFETLFDQPQINSFSLKFLVYVDAIYFRKKNRAQSLIKSNR